MLLVAAASCHHEKSEDAQAARAEFERDSTALKVAVMPIADCLPVYFAERMGIFAHEGVDVRVETFNAGMDIDTAFAGEGVDVAYSDLVRALVLYTRGTDLKLLMRTEGWWALMAGNEKNIESVRKLKEKMVGISRHSATDLLLDTIIKRNYAANPYEVYNPQINNISLRDGMLAIGTLDAAFLPEPYVSQSQERGDTMLYHSRHKGFELMTYIVKGSTCKDTRKKEQVKKFVKAYDTAVEQINSGLAEDTIRAIVRSFGVLPQTAENFAVPVYRHAERTHGDDLATARRFVVGRGLADDAADFNELVDTCFIETDN